MQYAGNIDSRVIAYAEEPGLSAGLMANESPTTLMLGMKGVPAMAERIAIERDLNLVRYSGVPLHFSGVSTVDAVRAIRNAKAEGLPVTAEVYVSHLLLTDEALVTFDSLFKLRPPLRSEDDTVALREAVLDGTIDVVCSDHSPQDTESKAVEFTYAAEGIIGLESLFGVLNKAFGGRLTLEHIYTILVSNPRKVLGIPVPQVDEGQQANATGFHPSDSWVFESSDIRSKSANSPFIGQTFLGKPIFVVNRGMMVAS
jgi:dihydroorotase